MSFFGAPAGIRTPDTLLKRQVLCLLSYWGVWLGWRDSNPLYRSQSPVCYHYTTSQCGRLKLLNEPGRAGLIPLWGGIWGSNPRHPEPQSGALPTELIPPFLARQEGFEPPTYCLEGSCSILLSYWRRSQLKEYGAGDGNRTHVSSLEGWCSTIELHPHGQSFSAKR